MQLRCLEKAVAVFDVTARTCALGHILFTLHSCARWSDLMSLAAEPAFDGHVVLVAETKKTKTSR
eukprot:1767721-Amphidinium_carterae.1